MSKRISWGASHDEKRHLDHPPRYSDVVDNHQDNTSTTRRHQRRHTTIANPFHESFGYHPFGDSPASGTFRDPNASLYQKLVAGKSRPTLSLVLLVALFVSILTNVGFLMYAARDKGLSSRIETHPVVFKENEYYGSIAPASDSLWDQLQGGSAGIVYAQTTDDGEVRATGTAMFHQLHCLNTFRLVVRELKDGSISRHVQGYRSAAYERLVPHCLNYLRQSILCAADSTLETSILSLDGRWVISGNNTQHQCHDSQALFFATRCGPQGCPSDLNYRDPDEMSRIVEKEKRQGGMVAAVGGKLGYLNQKLYGL